MNKTILEKTKKFASNNTIFLVFLGMVIIMTILQPSFLSIDNFKNVLRQMAPVGIIAIGITFALIAGGTDLSGGAVVAVTSCLVAKMVVTESTVPIAVAILLVMILGASAGCVNGLTIAYGNVPPFIGTLAMMSIGQGAALLITGGFPINGFRDEFKWIGSHEFFGILPVPVLILIVLAILAAILLHKTKFGSSVYAVGSNRTAAVVVGINAKKIRFLVYVLTGVMASISGVVLAARTYAATPTYGQGYDMDAITCAVIGGCSFSGGKGSIGGTLIGIMILGILTNGMTMLAINPNWQIIAKGVVVLFAVLFDQHKESKNS